MRFKYAGNWTQILGVFASRGNVKADVLAKIIVEATILCEKAGLFVDSVTCDGATWNRSMWRLFGVKGKSYSLIRVSAIDDGSKSHQPY